MSEERNLGAEMKAYLDAELRKLAVLPPSELEVALQSILEPFIQMAQVLQLAKQAWLEWVEKNYEPLRLAALAVGQFTQKSGACWLNVMKHFVALMSVVHESSACPRILASS